MKAYVVDDNQPSGYRFTEVPDPKPAPNEAVIAVDAFSLNNGELSGSGMFDDATVPGWDSAGRVIKVAADGTGPKMGARVVGGAWGGAWAERRAVGTDSLTVLPEEVDTETASTLPVAGITSLRAVRMLGGIVGRRVLVTGASGGVGRFAVQLARIAGAEVVAFTSSDSKKDALHGIGASEVASDLTQISSPVFAALEFSGGSTLVDAWSHVNMGGILISIGSATHTASTFPPFSTIVPRKSLLAMGDGWTPLLAAETVAVDLAYLARLVAARTLDPGIAWRGSWKQLPDALISLKNREISGKAVLRVD